MIGRNVDLFCCEDISLIENYDKAISDKNKMWHCHHRLEVQNDKRISVKELIKTNMYYNRPASELIFLTSSEHRSLHMKGRVVSEKEKIKISNGVKKYQVEHPITKEQHEKMSYVQQNMKFFNNGTISTKAFDCPEGFIPGRLKYYTKGNKGMHWYNNGEIQICCYEKDCPKGFKKGLLKRSKEHTNNLIKSRKEVLKNNPKYKERLRMAAKGRKRYTNGIDNIMIFGPCPEGYWPGVTRK